VTNGITKQVLRDARRARKLSIAEVAEFAGISEPRLRQLEVGDAEPTFLQLQKLGDLYNVAPYAFFSDKPLELDEALPDFRKSNPSEAKLSPKGLTRIWNIQKQSNFVAKLLEGLGRNAPKRRSLARITNRPQPDAEALRSNFDEWRDQVQAKLRYQYNDEDLFFAHFRLFVDVHSCNTILNSAPENDFLGFYSEDSGASSIFVNREIKFSRRKIFTICHEFAHFVYDEEGISNPFSAKNLIERQCNQYAAKFIAPDAVVSKIADRFRLGSRSEELISALSAETFLSKQAAAMRLADLDFISKKELGSHFGKSRSKFSESEFESPKTGAPMGRGAAIGKKLSEIGVYNAYVASCALKSNLVDRFDLQNALGLSDKLQDAVLDLAKRRFEAGAE
jgi:Zn-dependent peptidase ImmA (M78 family)/transcriptional regulator with XRE-family HTH domain